MARWIEERFEIYEILKFLVGGGSAVAADAILYVILIQHMDLWTSKAVSYVSGAVIGFIINKFWTFKSKRFRLSEVFRYVILYALSACVNTLVNKCSLLLFASMSFSFLCATGASTIINFLGQKFIVFRNT